MLGGEIKEIEVGAWGKQESMMMPWAKEACVLDL